MKKDLSRLIHEYAKSGITNLSGHLQEWAEVHLCMPRKIRLSIDSDGNEYSEFWLVTDNTGVDDSEYRVVYDEEQKCFGLAVTLENDIEWYMGAYGRFEYTVESM